MYYAIQGLALLSVFALYLVLRKSKNSKSQSGYFKDKIGDPIPSLSEDTRFRRFTNGLVLVGSLTSRIYLNDFDNYSDANKFICDTERKYQTKGPRISEIDHFLCEMGVTGS
jgi:hypothetical protein